MRSQKNFTLIEVIVVLVVIMLITGIAVSALRGESPSVALERNVLEVEAYIARVRFLCAESGRDYVVRFYPDKKLLLGHIDYSEEELLEMPRDISESAAAERFTFGEEVEFFTVEGAEDGGMENDYVEIFRFYPTGGGACINRPGIRVENLEKFFDLSFFSGRLIIEDGDGTGVEKK